MKKILSVLLVGLSLGFSVRAEDSDTQIVSTNTVGITCVTSSLEEFPLGVTYGCVSNINVTASITNILSTSTLLPGDQLWAFSGTTWNKFKLENDKSWSHTFNIDEPEQDEDIGKVKLPFGKGVWLIRQNLTGDRDLRIITCGQLPIGNVTTPISAGDGSNYTATIIAFPFSEPLDLNKDGLVDWVSTARTGDKINYTKEDGLSGSFAWRGGSWKHLVKGKYVSDGCVIPRGTFFKYNRKDSTAGSIVWNLAD